MLLNWLAVSQTFRNLRIFLWPTLNLLLISDQTKGICFSIRAALKYLKIIYSMQKNIVKNRLLLFTQNV